MRAALQFETNGDYIDRAARTAAAVGASVGVGAEAVHRLSPDSGAVCGDTVIRRPGAAFQLSCDKLVDYPVLGELHFDSFEAFFIVGATAAAISFVASVVLEAIRRVTGRE